MDVRKIIRKRIRRQQDGVQIASDVNAVISANVGERSSSSHVSSRQSVQAEQRRDQPDERDEAKEDVGS